MTHAGAAEPSAGELEGRIFSRYLLDREPPAALVGRYLDAERALFAAGAAPSEQRVLAFVHRHPWVLPFLSTLPPGC